MEISDQPTLLEFSSHPSTQGTLTVAQTVRELPFQPRRVYWTTSIPRHAKRGGHAHREISEVLVCLHGRCRVRTRDPHGGDELWRLDNPSQGLLIPPGWWRDLDEFEDDSVMLVMASGCYDEQEYIRDPERFFVTPQP